MSPRLLFLQHDSIFENYGGIQYYLEDFIQLASELYGPSQVRSLILSRKKHDRAPNKDYAASFVPICATGLRAKFDNRFPLALYREAARLIEDWKPEFLIASHVSLAPMTYLLSKRFQIAYGTIVYGMECWGNLWPQDEWSLRRSHRIFSISHWTKKILVDRGYRAERIRIVHPLLPSFYDDAPLVGERKNDPFRLLTISRLDPQEQYKGHDDTLRALALLRAAHPECHFKYQIVGEGGDQQRLEKLAQDLQLSPQVEFMHPVKDRAELMRLYAQSDLFVMPSRFGKWDGRWRGEGFGIVYVEAAACRVPSVAYACGGVTDIIENQQTGLLVEPDNHAGLARAIYDLMTDSQKRRRMGEQASRLVRERFSVAAVKREMEKAFS